MTALLRRPVLPDAARAEVARPPADRPGLRRQVFGGLALRISRYPLQAAFLLAVPPVLGPEVYGAYATCIAVFAIVVEVTDLGTMPLFGRLAPGMAPGASARLARQILWSRLALAAGPGVLVLWLLWTPRPEDPLLVSLVLAAFLITPLQQVLFGRLYAAGRILLVMARDPLRSALTLAFVVPGYLVAGLVGAVGTLVLAQLVLLTIATAWARPAARDFAPPETLSGLGGTLAFGLAAALPTILTVVSLKLGTALLARLGVAPAAVGAFDLATQGLALVVALANYPFAALLPTLGLRHDAGRAGEARAVLARVVSRATAAALVAVVGLALAGETVLGTVLGPGFAAVYPHLLVVIGIGILPVVVIQAGVAASILDKRPARAIRPAALLLAVTGAATLAGTARLGATAAAAGLAAGLAVQAAALLAETPGLATLVRPVGLGLAAALPLVALSVAEAHGALPASLPARLGAAAFPLAAAWHLSPPSRWRRFA